MNAPTHTTWKRITLAIVVPCLIGIGLLAARAAVFSTPSALLAIGPDNSSYAYVHADYPHAYVFDGNGFDGMVFYTIARHPFDVRRTAANLDVPTYRLRRILYPALAKAMSPSGGVGLVYAFAVLSLIGIGIGGWALSKFPHSPSWLPITMVVNAGTICALWTSTADALAAGLTLAFFAAAFRRRFAAAVILLAMAGLTRETSLVAAVALLAWPDLRLRRRLAGAALAVMPVALWSLYVAAQLHESMFDQPSAGSFAAPLIGWIREPPAGGQLILALFTGVLMLTATVIGWRAYRPVALYLVATLAMYVCAAPVITNQWVGFARITTVAFPLSIWLIVARARAPQAFDLDRQRPISAVAR